MKLLLDTHVFLWTIFESHKIPPKIRRIIQQGDTAVWVSTISLWGIALKHSLGKLKLKGLSPEKLIEAAKEQDFNTITISESDATEFGSVKLSASMPICRRTLALAAYRALRRLNSAR